MKKRLPPWCKLVKHTLIDKDMDVSELATKTGLARPYLSSIINGRIYSQPAARLGRVAQERCIKRQSSADCAS